MLENIYVGKKHHYERDEENLEENISYKQKTVCNCVKYMRKDVSGYKKNRCIVCSLSQTYFHK